MREVVIVAAARTPIGSFMGSLSSVTATELGATAIAAALERSTLSADQVGEVFMGCVLAAGLGQAPARQAAIRAGLPQNVPCTTINKVCGSGLKAVIAGAQSIMTEDAEVVVAGGMESMSNTPYLSQGARQGLRMGNAPLIDSMIHDGLWDVYNQQHMGNCAELCAKEKGFSREAQDEHAAQSYRRALETQKAGGFADEITAVSVPQRKGDPIQVAEDEEPGRGNIEKLAKLRPAFDKQGSVTAGNASSLNDGAAAVVLMSGDAAKRHGIKPLARITSWGHHAQAPEWFTTAPAGAIKDALDYVKWDIGSVDLWELNEAFSVVSLVNNQMLDLDASKVNIKGGAVALGHPIGASGARILTTLLYSMKEKEARRGGASLCIGGGEGICLLVERS